MAYIILFTEKIKKVDLMIQSDMDELYESIAKEMRAKKNRVRNIIGNSHWGEEGKYKEIILKKIIHHRFRVNFYGILSKSLAACFVLYHEGYHVFSPLFK